MTLRRAAQPASRILRGVRRAGGFTQINHPTIFPASNPLFALLCRGCSWEYSGRETDFPLVDAIEVNTGPQRIGEAPNPFTATAIDFYERALRAGATAAAVASSDSHHAGDTPGGATQSPLGVGATAVYARELSERGVRCAVQAGHTYAKLGGPRGPDLRLRARAPGARRRAIFGDAVRGRRLTLVARAPGASAASVLQLVRNGRVIRTGRRKLRHTAKRSGRYGLRLVRGTITEAVGTPVSFTRRGGRGRVTVRKCGSDRGGGRGGVWCSGWFVVLSVGYWWGALGGCVGVCLVLRGGWGGRLRVVMVVVLCVWWCCVVGWVCCVTQVRCES